MGANNSLNISEAGYVTFDGINTFHGRTFQAGTGIVLTNASGVAGNTTISATPVLLNYTNVNHAASPYTVLSTDQYISVDTSGGTVSLLFPNSPTAQRQWIIKDRTGNAAANNLTITTVGGAVNIDGATTYVINTNYGSIQLLANSTPTYEVF